MNFQSLPVVPSAQELLDKAFSRARKRSEQLRASKTRLEKNARARMTTREKMKKTSEVLSKDLSGLVSAYPDFANLPEFYEELCKNQLDIDLLRESLGRVQGTATQIMNMNNEAQQELRGLEGVTAMKACSTKFYGRVSSSVKRMDSSLRVIEKARRVLTSFPAVKEDVFTVALAGFPNVGKSTLLSKLTSAKPLIANYAFTTKTLNVGYFKIGYHEVQVIDTPGTLARYEKMNEIEQMAYLCLKYVADCIIMIIDPTESYELEDQERLLENLKEHDKPITVYVSKTDIVNEQTTKTMVKRYQALASVEEVKTFITKSLHKH